MFIYPPPLSVSNAGATRAPGKSSSGGVRSRLGWPRHGDNKLRPSHRRGALFGDGSLVLPALSPHTLRLSRCGKFFEERTRYKNLARVNSAGWFSSVRTDVATQKT